jgi:cytochrome c-type biogenesis protein
MSSGTKTWAGVGLAVSLLLALFASGLVLIPRYQAAHPPSYLQRSDADQIRLDDLFLDVTLVTPGFLRTRKLESYLGDRKPDSVLPILVGLNTHTGDIGHMHHLPGQLTLVGPDGSRYPSLTEPIVLSQHHNAYLLMFPGRDNRGFRFIDQKQGVITLEAANMGKRPLRSFAWELPLPADAEPGDSAALAAKLVLGVALLSALLVVLSPCALELTLYYTAIISCTVSQGAEPARSATQGPADSKEALGRKRLLTNLGSFVAGFTLLYAVSGATVGLIGQGVRRPLGNYGELIPLIGGTLILFFALRVAGVGSWIRTRWLARGSSHGQGSGLLAPLWHALACLRDRGRRSAASSHGMRARDSFLVGMGLSSACLSCMGGAVLYPLLVYAGITSWYSGLITLTLYSLGIAVPMIFIALGFFRMQISLTKRIGFNRILRLASAAMLAGIGLLILSGHERVLTDLTFRFLAEVATWSV